MESRTRTSKARVKREWRRMRRSLLSGGLARNASDSARSIRGRDLGLEGYSRKWRGDAGKSGVEGLSPPAEEDREENIGQPRPLALAEARVGARTGLLEP
jgi:hypothetical protein